ETAFKTIEKHYHVPKEKTVIIPHGHYVGIYTNKISKQQARQNLSIPANAFVFAFVGQIRPYKGIENLLISFTQITQAYPNAFLIIAGKTLLPYKKDQIKSMVSFLNNVIIVEDFIEDNDLQLYFNAADFIVTPYTDILTSGSVLNAISFSKPVIAPSIGMIPEVVEDGVSGFLYDNT